MTTEGPIQSQCPYYCQNTSYGAVLTSVTSLASSSRHSHILRVEAPAGLNGACSDIKAEETVWPEGNHKGGTYFPAVLKCTDTGRQCDSAKASKPLKNETLKQERRSVGCVRPRHKRHSNKLASARGRCSSFNRGLTQSLAANPCKPDFPKLTGTRRLGWLTSSLSAGSLRNHPRH